ncbi:hypothetical protein ACIBCT_33895 [Streptosporangium sp. NPDC050855]|uniref:hypothetical protein n=1 Tax=Streptosporangium sp. NPDC050855 TaxID=3366194 RepID=UPI0037B6B425
MSEAPGAHTYSEAASTFVPLGHRRARSGGGWMRAQSANVMVRAHRATPSAPLMARRPWCWAYHAAYPAKGSAPARSSAVSCRRPTRRTASTNTTSRNSGSAIVLVSAAAANSRPAPAAARADNRGDHISTAVPATIRKMNCVSDRTACSSRRKEASNSSGTAAGAATRPGTALRRSTA